jgi:hypothetical protein
MIPDQIQSQRGDLLIEQHRRQEIDDHALEWGLEALGYHPLYIERVIVDNHAEILEASVDE